MCADGAPRPNFPSSNGRGVGAEFPKFPLRRPGVLKISPRGENRGRKRGKTGRERDSLVKLRSLGEVVGDSGKKDRRRERANKRTKRRGKEQEPRTAAGEGGRGAAAGREKKRSRARRISPELLFPPMKPEQRQPAGRNNATYRATHIPGYWYAR